jgi:glyoxylate/succinic semialdehyde reductase
MMAALHHNSGASSSSSRVSVATPCPRGRAPSSRPSGGCAPLTAAAAAAADGAPASSSSCAVPTATPGKTTLAFVGIGIMGLAMTTNLLKAGYDVVVWNRSPERCAPLVALGAKLAASAADAARRADVTFGMLSDPPAALAVGSAGPDSVAAGMSPGKGYVDVSTVDAQTSKAVAQAVRARGGLFLEAPVSGSKGPAEQGQLFFLTADDAQLFAAASPALDVMGKAKFYLGGADDGQVGAGAAMKLVINQVMGAQLAAFAEGLALAKAAGLSQEDVLQVASLGAIACPMFALKGPGMVKRSYPTAFPLKHQQKDLRLSLELAQEVGLGGKMGVAAAAYASYCGAADKGHGDDDFSAVMEHVLADKGE